MVSCTAIASVQDIAADLATVVAAARRLVHLSLDRAVRCTGDRPFSRKQAAGSLAAAFLA
jgi:hypothetical protein